MEPIDEVTDAGVSPEEEAQETAEAGDAAPLETVAPEEDQQSDSPKAKPASKKSAAEDNLLGEGTEEGFLKEMRDAFAYLDRRRMQKLPTSLLEEVVSMLGIPFPGPEKRQEVLRMADPSDSGFFTVNTLQDVVKSLKQGTSNPEDIVVAYRLFDKENKGYFTKADLKAVLSRFTNGSASEEDILQIMGLAGSAGTNTGDPEAPKEPVITKDTFLSLFQ